MKAPIKSEQPLSMMTRMKNIMLMLMLLPISFLTNANDVNATMSVSPAQCVAMSQGQSCYVSVELTWQVAVPGNYCVYANDESNALRCWENSSGGELKKSFDSKVNLRFALRRQSDNEAIVASVVKMAWVHKKKGQPRTSWRLF